MRSESPLRSFLRRLIRPSPPKWSLSGRGVAHAIHASLHCSRANLVSATGRYLKLGPIILLASLASADALANDSIRITFASGDRILQSGETSEIQVTRSG